MEVNTATLGMKNRCRVNVKAYFEIVRARLCLCPHLTISSFSTYPNWRHEDLQTTMKLLLLTSFLIVKNVHLRHYARVVKDN